MWKFNNNNKIQKIKTYKQTNRYTKKKTDRQKSEEKVLVSSTTFRFDGQTNKERERERERERKGPNRMTD